MKPDHSLSLCYQLLNTAASPCFPKAVATPWPETHRNAHYAAINDYAADSVHRALTEVQRNPAQLTAFRRYLEKCEQHFGVKAQQARGLIHDFSVEDYIAVTELLHTVSTPHAMDSTAADCHQLLVTMANYLLAKDSVTNGTGHTGLEQVFAYLTVIQSPAYFREGAPYDLLVHDRVALHSDASSITHLLVRTSGWLSTTPLSAKEAAAYQTRATHDPALTLFSVKEEQTCRAAS